MQLVRRGLEGRAFLLQFREIMLEFAHEIPWLEPVRSITYSTNPVYFRDKFLKSVGCKGKEEITPFQLVTSDASREYVGGIVRFARSPERFSDRRNNEVVERFTHEGYDYVSCLQVRNVLRGEGNGDLLMRRALRSILAAHPRIWGVVSRSELLPWYRSLGAQVEQFPDSLDKLSIIRWNDVEQI
ncbi:MAG: hypothetical protein V4674_02975 [Patescibacteria group bacterium]